MNRRKRKKIQKIKKIFFTLFIITLIIILLCNIKSCTKNNNKDSIYGYALIRNNSSSKILELHTKKENVELDNLNNIISDIVIKNKRLVYYTKNTNKKDIIKYINITDDNLEPKTITENVNLDNTFEITDKYLLVSLQKNGIKKYNLDTLEETTILDTIGAYDFFILDNKMYASTYKYENKKNIQKYYTCTLDGYEFNWIEKEEYDNLKKKIENNNINNKPYLMINNKKISVSHDNHKLLYGDNVIYSNENKNIKLMFTNEENKIAFLEYTISNGQEIEEDYFTYDIKNKNLNEVNKNSIYKFSTITLS